MGQGLSCRQIRNYFATRPWPSRPLGSSDRQPVPIRFREGRTLEDLRRVVGELETDVENLAAYDTGPDRQRLRSVYRDLIGRMERVSQEYLVGVRPGQFYTDRYRLIAEATIPPSNFWSEAYADGKAWLVWFRDLIDDLSRGADMDVSTSLLVTPAEQQPLPSAVDELHPSVASAARGLYASGHYSQAIFEALKALEVRVQEQSGLHDLLGRNLMSQALQISDPSISLTAETGRAARDEQEGLRFVFMGVMQGLRNPKAHRSTQQEDPQRAFEYLSLVSVLFRRLDDANGAAS